MAVSRFLLWRLLPQGQPGMLSVSVLEAGGVLASWCGGRRLGWMELTAGWRACQTSQEVVR